MKKKLYENGEQYGKEYLKMEKKICKNYKKIEKKNN